MEAIGLAMAAIGVLPQIFSLANSISSTISDTKRFGPDAESLRIKFQSENQSMRSYLSWLFGQQISADGGMFRFLPRDTQANVLAMIIELRSRFHDYGEVERKYGLGVLEPTEETKFRDALEGPPITNRRSFDLQKSTSVWARIRWAMSGKKVLDELIKDLSEWNGRLRNIVQDVVWQVQLSASEIRAVEDSPNTKAAGMELSAKMRRLIISDEAITQELKIPQYKVVNIHRDPGKEGPYRAKIDDCPVIVEYKTYEMGGHAEITMRRVRKLATLLHSQKDPSFRVLPCRGYFEDRVGSRFGFVFDIPPGASPKPTSLHDALNVASSRSKRPSITQRLKLAHKVAESLYLLHTVGWVHKSLRSESILFFETNATAGKSGSMYETPWLSGFEYSRVETDFSSVRVEDRLERNLYRHWDRWDTPTERASKIHDIYSLGVILLEIGLWQGLKTFSKDGFQSLTRNPRGVTEALRNVARGRLGFSMGEKYEKIVLMCLEGNETAFGVEDDSRAGTGLQKEFRENIVEVLDRASRYV